jgi:hypothetical protein
MLTKKEKSLERNEQKDGERKTRSVRDLQKQVGYFMTTVAHAQWMSDLSRERAIADVVVKKHQDSKTQSLPLPCVVQVDQKRALSQPPAHYLIRFSQRQTSDSNCLPIDLITSVITKI